MTTAVKEPETPGRSPSAHEEPTVADGTEPVNTLLTVRDLKNIDKFHILRGIPLIDAHNHEEKGEIDESLLNLLAKNSNERAHQDRLAAVTLGHSQRHRTVVVIRPDRTARIFPAVPEEVQTPIVGYASNFTVAPYHGKPWLHADLSIYHEHTDKLRDYPGRSIERMEPQQDGEDDGDDLTRHYVDRVCLLKVVPERMSGPIQYSRDGDACCCADDIIDCDPSGRCLLRVSYAREFPPPGDDGLRASPSSPGEPDMPEAPVKKPPAAAAPPPEEPAAPEAPPDGGAMPPDDGGAAQAGLPATFGEMSPADAFEAFAHIVRLVLDERANGGGEPEPAPGDEGLNPPPPEEPEPDEDRVPYGYDGDGPIESGQGMGSESDENRVPYDSGAACAGGSNAFVPGFAAGKRKTTMYSRDQGGTAAAPVPAAQPPAKPANGHVNPNDVVRRYEYAKDQSEKDEVLQFLYEGNVKLENEIKDMKVKERRLLYQRDVLSPLIKDEGIELDDEAIKELLDEITPDTPADHEEKMKNKIRKYYSRRAVNVPGVPVGSPDWGRAVPQGAPSPSETKAAIALAFQSRQAGKDMSFTDALTAVRAK